MTHHRKNGIRTLADSEHVQLGSDQLKRNPVCVEPKHN